MKRSITISILLIILTACTTPGAPVIIRCPKIEMPKEPHYPKQDLKKGDSAETVVKAYVATLQAKDHYIYTQLRPYFTRTPAESNN